MTTADQLLHALSQAKQLGVPHTIIGRGSNLLFNDGVYNGLAIAIRMEAWRLQAYRDTDLKRQTAAGTLPCQGLPLHACSKQQVSHAKPQRQAFEPGYSIAWQELQS